MGQGEHVGGDVLAEVGVGGDQGVGVVLHGGQHGHNGLVSSRGLICKARICKIFGIRA